MQLERTRSISLLLTASAMVADSPPSIAQVIYSDSLSSAWQNWSWDTSIDFANASPSIGQFSMKVSHTEGWAGLQFFTPNPIMVDPNGGIRFSIHGGSQGGQSLVFRAVNPAGAEQDIALAPPVAGRWREYELSAAQIQHSSIQRWFIQNNAPDPVTTYFVDDVSLFDGAGGGPGASADGPAITVNAASGHRLISDHIYGVNFFGSDFKDRLFWNSLGVTLRRFGGNSSTRYNWQIDAAHRGKDWFFVSGAESSGANPSRLPHGSLADQIVEESFATDMDVMITIPIIGWTTASRNKAWSFSVAKYGPQQSVEPFPPFDAGDGFSPSGQPIVGNDPFDTCIEVDSAFASSWVTHLTNKYGTADRGGVRFYAMDNEPMLWTLTHRDVRPNPLGYQELVDRTIDYATAVKGVDPSAEVLGYQAWGFPSYYFSDIDRKSMAGGSGPIDRLANDDLPLAAWYLRELKAHEDVTGVRLLDYLNLHFYPQGQGVALSAVGSRQTQELRLRQTRGLWDPSYVDESWINQPIAHIPTMQAWVDQFYSGTKTAITEYNFGALEHINGAVAQADVLGIFGREGLDLATMWGPPASGDPAAFAFRMYRNYDGMGSRFAPVSVSAKSANQDEVSAYASFDGFDRATIVLVNKSFVSRSVPLDVQGFTATSPASLYRYSDSNLQAIDQLPQVSITPGQITQIELPAQSVTLIEINGTSPCPVDLDANAESDAVDLVLLIDAMTNGLPFADLNADSVVDWIDLVSFASRLQNDCSR